MQLSSSSRGPKKQLLQPVISPPEWNALIARFETQQTKQVPIMMICGPKGSGKSTFVRLLSNRLVTRAMTASTGVMPAPAHQKNPGLALLDLDPGQPEFSPPGQLSLIHVREPNFGPQFSHPAADGAGCNVVKAHNITALSPAADSAHYMACVLDLLTHYKHHLSQYPNCPLVINTPGWILGTGLEILIALVRDAAPTSIVYMSREGPAEAVDALMEAAQKTPFYTLPSQAGDFEARTSAQLRTMQYMSYFHHERDKNNRCLWKDTPLSSIPPWQISYSGKSSGILGIMCTGEQPPLEMVKDTINGSILSAVVIDDPAAISHTQGLEESSLITRTPEGLPYFNPAYTSPIDPKYSHTIGLVMIRGIDTQRQKLHILTPITSETIDDVFSAGKSIVLVNGSLDTPGWAYLEEINKRANAERKARREAHQESVSDEDSSESSGDGDALEAEHNTFEDVPWVERVHGSKGRGIEARVWRVRRDLGKMGSEGD
jgi:polynucleotide 5'-hydroxyl-kinase GRC3/NOL9